MTDIFISYSQTDQDVARRLYQELKKFKVRGFMDTVDVAAGARLSRQISEAVESADVLLVILSESAAHSSWVMAEIGMAQSLGKSVLPVLAPGQSYDKSVPPQLLDSVVIDANSITLENVAAKIVAAATNTSVDTALSEVHSRVIHRQKILVATTVVLVALLTASVLAGMFAYNQRAFAVKQERLATEARELAEARLQRLELLTGDSASIAIAPDGVHVATGAADGAVRIWEIETGQTVATLSGHGDSISGLAYSPDARHLASASWDGTVRIWDIVTGQEVMTLVGHTDAVIGVQFTPDGSALLSRSLDGTTRQWSATTGRLIRTLRTPK